MKINLVKIKLSQCDKYKYKPIKWCCNEMRNNPVTLFTNDDLVRIDDWIYHGYPQMCLNYDYVEQDYEDDYEIIKNYPIKYCPWCGEKIEINVADELDMVSRERDIINKLKNLHEKINKSDSISERTRLSKKEELLRDEIDKMYDLDEWTGENM